MTADWVEIGITKDAGDDPDVTHGALIIARVARSLGGVRFHAGDGVGTITKAGLPIAMGEPAINPVPRQMMQAEVEELAVHYGQAPDIDITIRRLEAAKLVATNKPAELALNVADSRDTAKLICTTGL